MLLVIADDLVRAGATYRILLARQLRLVRYLRTAAGSAQQHLSQELGPEFENLDLRDLNPKTFVQKHFLDDIEPIIADVKSQVADVGKTINNSSSDITDAINSSKDHSPEVRRASWTVPRRARP